MILYIIQKILEKAKVKQWDKTYWAFDIHETVIVPNWKIKPIPTTFYPFAKECLQLISQREEVVLFLYTCSHPNEVAQYLKLFEMNNIHFSYVNENPEVINFKYGNYEKKPYFNILFEDKAGFNPEQDWELVLNYLTKYWSPQ